MSEKEQKLMAAVHRIATRENAFMGSIRAILTDPAKSDCEKLETIGKLEREASTRID